MKATKSRDNAVGIVTGYGLDDGGVGVRVPVEAEISILPVVETGYEIHPASYSMGTEGKAAGA
jgi:hypothetical protein